MQTIKIDVDVDKKEVSVIKGTEGINPVDLTKIFMSIAMGSLNRIAIKEKKIIEPKTKILR
jgi:hypothetical protein